MLKPEILEKMWTRQFANTREPSRFGLGFALSKFEGHRMVGHNGAIYGFATSLAALPDDKLGAVAVTTMDSSNAVTDHIVREALRLMLAKREHETIPTLEFSEPVDPALARRLAGRYGKGADAVDLKERNGHLFMLPLRGGFQVELRSLGNALIVDDRLAYGTPVVPLRNAVRLGTKRLEKVTVSKPAAAPRDWKDLIGEYGWDYDTLYILEKDGRLTALIEWYEYDPLRPISKDVFAFPDYGLYDHEKAVFVRDEDGRVEAVRVGWVTFKRRPLGKEVGSVFKIQPVKPVTELRREALAASCSTIPTVR